MTGSSRTGADRSVAGGIRLLSFPAEENGCTSNRDTSAVRAAKKVRFT